MTNVMRRGTKTVADLPSWLESNLEGVLEARVPPPRIPSSDGPEER